MPDRKPTSLPFESDDRTQRALWTALGDLPRGEPPDRLRRRFYSGLHDAARQPWHERLGRWLGLRAGGWVTAAACLALGFAVAEAIDAPATDAGRLAVLEENMNRLQRELILDRLQDAAATTRLRGVVDASEVAASDPQVAQALLERAAQDRSLSVRSAAIDALGPQLGSGEVGRELMRLLEGAESPIVQLALVDLVLRHGDADQIRQLQNLADRGRLHPDLVRHVNNALGNQSI